MSINDDAPPKIPSDAAADAATEFESAGVLSGPEWRPDDAAEAARAEADFENTASLGDGAGAFSSTTHGESAPSAAGLPSERGETGLAEKEEEPAKMTLMGHLNELRLCLIRSCIAVGIAFLVCWAVVDPIFDVLVNPLLAVLPPNSTAIYTTLPEGFFTRMFIAFVASLFLASPVIFYQLWSFIAPGLYEEEKSGFIPIALASACFFISGGFFCYFIVFPYAFEFFVSYSTATIVVMPKISDYLDFVLKLILAFGLIFEMPLFAFFLARMGIVTAAMMRRVRRYAVLAIFVVAAILTPPDVVSQLLMACPMLLLYEVSILVAAVFGRARKKNSAAAPETEVV
ncbi:MAG: twin-arginine translocase subunit TatC [Desulfovibrio sp.]|jgi:sec-independent protein translocase protein TatC|nr:twin-arginine translocase subunit TatC [Desulfovibrio sp.]